MIAGHGALAVILAHGPAKGLPWWLPTMLAYGPDLVDKPLMWFGEWSGRGLGHSLLFFLLVPMPFLLLLHVRRHVRMPGLATLAALWLLHLLCDATDPRALLWPLLHSFPAPSGFSLGQMLRLFYLEADAPLLLAGDLLLCTVALGLFLRGRLVPQETD